MAWVTIFYHEDLLIEYLIEGFDSSQCLFFPSATTHSIMVSEKLIRKIDVNLIFICLGSADAGMTVHKDSYSLSAKMKLLGQRLNLRPHLVGAGGTNMYTAADIEGTYPNLR